MCKQYSRLGPTNAEKCVCAFIFLPQTQETKIHIIYIPSKAPPKSGGASEHQIFDNIFHAEFRQT